MKQGRFTIPADAAFAEESLKIAKKWGADAVRDCDGTAARRRIYILLYSVKKRIKCISIKAF